MRDAILTGFSEDTFVEVKDISGGCGSMYAIEVESLDFKGVSKVKQSRMVNDLIKKEIGEVSGLWGFCCCLGSSALFFSSTSPSPFSHPPFLDARPYPQD